MAAATISPSQELLPTDTTEMASPQAHPPPAHHHERDALLHRVVAAKEALDAEKRLVSWIMQKAETLTPPSLLASSSIMTSPSPSPISDLDPWQLYQHYSMHDLQVELETHLDGLEVYRCLAVRRINKFLSSIRRAQPVATPLGEAQLSPECTETMAIFELLRLERTRGAASRSTTITATMMMTTTKVGDVSSSTLQSELDHALRESPAHATLHVSATHDASSSPSTPMLQSFVDVSRTTPGDSATPAAAAQTHDSTAAESNPTMDDWDIIIQALNASTAMDAERGRAPSPPPRPDVKVAPPFSSSPSPPAPPRRSLSSWDAFHHSTRCLTLALDVATAVRNITVTSPTAAGEMPVTQAGVAGTNDGSIIIVDNNNNNSAHGHGADDEYVISDDILSVEALSPVERSIAFALPLLQPPHPTVDARLPVRGHPLAMLLEAVMHLATWLGTNVVELVKRLVERAVGRVGTKMSTAPAALEMNDAAMNELGVVAENRDADNGEEDENGEEGLEELEEDERAVERRNELIDVLAQSLVAHARL